MSEILEILTSKGNGGQKFTVDTALPPAGQTIATQGSFECDNSEQKSLFARGDNIAIVSAGIILPESFLLGNIGFGVAPLAALPRLNIYFYTEPAHVKYYPIISGATGNFSIPMENYEYILNSFVDVTKGPFKDSVGVTVYEIPGNFTCYLSIDPGTVKISMVNVPAILHGQVMRITPFIKVIHNIPLIS
jgi:hypothetical protein